VHEDRPRIRLDREQLLTVARSHRDEYASAQPFPHVVLDGLFAEPVLLDVLAEFPSPDSAQWREFKNARERKLATNTPAHFGGATYGLLAELNSAAFLDFLEELTGITGLVPDPHFVGGGLHQIERGGLLKVHADFNRHERTGLYRRLNVLLYLNREWKEEYAGGLELWDEAMSECEARILPVFNRCVVFTITDTAFHGHPDPLTCPEGWSRKSLASYYYSLSPATKATSATEATQEHSTLFKARPGEDITDLRRSPTTRWRGLTTRARNRATALAQRVKRASADH
jgi:hypothetical protein